MADNLTVFGVDYTGVTGIKAKGTGNGTLAYIRPQGTKSISANGTGIDVAAYSTVDVAVASQDSTFVVTLSWNSTSEMWEPDCTISELQNAYDGGKEIVFIGENRQPAGWFYDDDYSYVYGIYTGNGNNTLLFREYWFTSQGVSHSGDTQYIMPVFDSPSRAYTPTTQQQTEVITFNSGDGYNGIQQVSVTVNAMPTGTAGTPSATKGTVSNHAVSVTPSVTNTAGYIAGGTLTGTAVSVSASELVSGSETKTANGTYDVTNLASVTVDIDFVTYYTSSSNPTSSQGSNGDIWLVTS